MKIGELARRSGLTERMLRHYEDLGIISPAKTAKGTRLYGDQDLAVAELMRDLRNLDVPLDVVADIAKERAGHATGDASSKGVGPLLDTLAEDLARKAQQALDLRRDILAAAQKVQACHGCENVPGAATCPDCPMNEAVSENSVAALVWG